MSKQNIIGIDIGGTLIKAGLIRNHKIVKLLETPVRKYGQFLIPDLLAIIQWLKTSDSAAIGIAMPGEIDPSKGVFHYCHHFPKITSALPLAKIIKEKVGLPVYLRHDVDCFTLAEAVLGQGRKYPIVAGLTLGTGVGFALVINKKIYSGSQNLVEFGHVIIDKDGIPCPCGGRGHFESFVSGQAMIKLYQQKTGQRKNTYAIVAAAKKREKAALATLKIISDYLAVGLANIIYVYNPHIIVIGGGLSVVNILINPACQKVKKLLLYKDQLKTKIVKSKTPYQSNILGAALITNRKKYE